MADRTSIEWTDATWPVIAGCDPASPGCDHCYAARLTSGRLKHLPAYQGLAVGGKFTGEVRTLPERLDWPLKWKKPRRIFVSGMADLFHSKVDVDFIAQVWAVMSLADQHTFQILTKRHARPHYLLGHAHRDFRAVVDEHRERLRPGCGDYTWPLPNVWMGVSVEDQRWADIRIPVLLDTPAAVRWISAEPLLGPIKLDKYWVGADALLPDERGIDWVVVGGESGHNARPMHPNWARSLRDQCQAAALPFHFKQWGEWGPAPFVVRVCDPKVGWTGTAEELVEAKRAAEAQGATHVHTGNWYEKDGRTLYHIHEIGHPCWGLERAELPDDHMAPIRRWGKTAAGRELDGEIWDKYPAVTR